MLWVATKEEGQLHAGDFSLEHVRKFINQQDGCKELELTIQHRGEVSNSLEYLFVIARATSKQGDTLTGYPLMRIDKISTRMLCPGEKRRVRLSWPSGFPTEKTSVVITISASTKKIVVPHSRQDRVDLRRRYYVDQLRELFVSYRLGLPAESFDEAFNVIHSLGDVFSGMSPEARSDVFYFSAVRMVVLCDHISLVLGLHPDPDLAPLAASLMEGAQVEMLTNMWGDFCKRSDEGEDFFAEVAHDAYAYAEIGEWESSDILRSIPTLHPDKIDDEQLFEVRDLVLCATFRVACPFSLHASSEAILQDMHPAAYFRSLCRLTKARRGLYSDEDSLFTPTVASGAPEGSAAVRSADLEIMFARGILRNLLALTSFNDEMIEQLHEFGPGYFNHRALFSSSVMVADDLPPLRPLPVILDDLRAVTTSSAALGEVRNLALPMLDFLMQRSEQLQESLNGEEKPSGTDAIGGDHEDGESAQGLVNTADNSWASSAGTPLPRDPVALWALLARTLLERAHTNTPSLNNDPSACPPPGIVSPPTRAKLRAHSRVVVPPWNHP